MDILKRAMAMSSKTAVEIILDSFKRLNLAKENINDGVAEIVLDRINETNIVPQYVVNECEFITREAT